MHWTGKIIGYKMRVRTNFLYNAPKSFVRPLLLLAPLLFWTPLVISTYLLFSLSLLSLTSQVCYCSVKALATLRLLFALFPGLLFHTSLGLFMLAGDVHIYVDPVKRVEGASCPRSSHRRHICNCVRGSCDELTVWEEIHG